MDPSELRERAVSAFAKGRFTKAAELYEAYCAQVPKDSQAWIRLGDAWSRLRKKDKAVLAYYQAAKLYADSGFFPRAIAACKLVLEIEPEHSGVKGMLEELYVHKAVPRASGGLAHLAKPTPSSFKESSPASAQAEPSHAEPSATTEPLALAARVPSPIPLPGKIPEALSLVDELPIVLGQEELSEELEEEALELKIPEQPPQPLSEKVPFLVGTLLKESPLPQALPSPQKKPSDAQISPPVAPRPSAVLWADDMKPPAIRPAVLPAALKTPPAVSKTPSLPPTSGLEKKTKSSEAVPVFDLEAPPLPVAEETKAPPTEADAQRSRPSNAGAFYAIEDAAKASLEEQGENPHAWLSMAKHTTPSLGLPVDIPLFSELPQPALMALFGHCPLRRFSPGTLIITQGDRGNSFFVICSGEVRVFRKQDEEQVELAILKEGEFFGEMALLSGEPRSAFVEAVEPDTQVLEISASALAGLSRKFPQVSTALWRFYRQRLLNNVMAGSPLFQPFAQEDRQQLIRRFQAVDIHPQTVVISQNTMSEGLFVVLAGHLEVVKEGQKIAVLKEGDLFGEISLLTKAPATASVIAVERSSLLKLPASDFNNLICTHPQVLELLSRLMEERMNAENAEEEFSLESLGWDNEDFELLI